MVNVIPEGFNTLTPTMVLSNAAEAIALYIKIFGAKSDYCMKHPENGRILHACLQFGDSKLFIRDVLDICDEVADHTRFYLYADDVTAVCNLAVSNGFEQIVMPPEDMYWGDRLGMVRDKFGVTWIVATHERKVSDADLETGRQDFIRSITG